MRILLVNNSELVIGAKSEADYTKALKVAEEIVASGFIDCTIASTEHGEFIHITACSDSYQAQEFKSEYAIAKNTIKGQS